MPITPLPTAPSRGQAPDVFALTADAWVAALGQFSVQLEAARLEVGGNTSTAGASAAAAAAAAAAAGAVAWVSGTTYAIGDARTSPADLQTYRRKTAGAGTTDPSLDSTNWTRFNLAANSIARSARTSNTALVEADRGTLIDASSTFTQTFTAAATLTSGWFCWIRNSGSGAITLDPNAAELIDGLSSYVMYPGEARLVQCDGVAFTSIVLAAFRLEPVSTMNFIEPPGYRGYEVFLAAPGGGGGSGRRGAAGSIRSGGSSGGAGGAAWGTVRASAPGASITLTVGANGTGGAAVAVNDSGGSTGTAGGTHSFGVHLAAAGGSGGTGGQGGTLTGGFAGVAVGLVTLAGTAGGGIGNLADGIAGVSGVGWGATGGGGGGGIYNNEAVFAAGAGGASGTGNAATQLAGGIAGITAGTRPGGNGSSSSAQRGGTGGGGGAAHASAAGANGGNGVFGGGGGGGSGSINGQLSGAGGSSTGYFYVGGIR